jgi:hypothetical protein
MKPISYLRLHIIVWVLMLFYFVFAPDLFASFFLKNGKPLQIDAPIPSESHHINFVVEDLVPYVKDGENLYELFGWAFMHPEAGMDSSSLVQEIMLVSNERSYLFSVRSGYRKPKLPDKFTDIQLNFDSLGFSALLLEDLIQPGKYRVAVVFRYTSDGSAYYWDKPVYYLIKTPNTLRLERK